MTDTPRTRLAVALSAGDPSVRIKAEQLALRLQVPLLPSAIDVTGEHCDFLLYYLEQVLTLRSFLSSPAQTICVAFDDASFMWRQKQPLGSEALVKALGGRKSLPLRIVDATAGLGQDSFILAAAGFNVHMIEASPVVHALLEDGLSRAMHCELTAVSAAARRLELSYGDSARMLLQLGKVDIIYLDPMFPERRKTAKVKKNMQVLQQLLEHSEEADVLLPLALEKATRRVVVKRPRHAPWLNAQKPAIEITGKSSRFDIYLC